MALPCQGQISQNFNVITMKTKLYAQTKLRRTLLTVIFCIVIYRISRPELIWKTLLDKNRSKRKFEWFSSHTDYIHVANSAEFHPDTCVKSLTCTSPKPSGNHVLLTSYISMTYDMSVTILNSFIFWSTASWTWFNRLLSKGQNLLLLRGGSSWPSNFCQSKYSKWTLTSSR